MSDFEQIVDQLRGTLASASLEARMPDNDLRDVLSFLVKVTQVVDQTFQDVLTLAIECAYLVPGPELPERLRRLGMELDLLTARSHYRESLEICSRLKHLKGQFEDHIRPTVMRLADSQEWQQLFWLIEDREGRIITLVEDTARMLRGELAGAQTGDVRAVTGLARELVDELRPLLVDLRDLTNRILGLSGRQGFLELTRDRNALRQAVNFVVRQGDFHMSGDVYNTRNAGAVGPGAQATNTTINENYGAVLQGVDMLTLAKELEQLKGEMRKQAQETSQFEAITAVSGAQDAARANQPSTVIERLKSVGGWALDVASKIGVSVASEAIKKASGIG